ncbi:putative kinesin-like protein KIFC1-like 2 [Homarus americanus]|uniref:Putative kinesin-like protein KIFC1-like 2 n=1 Tax=Homarus americanus TaxID=6706 RepID=A0A8J5JFV5_HOMAM|nr:putative kinesin-like protein KIFC1-like 2 [Homarus americanus]
MIVPHPDEKGRFPITNGKEANSGSLCPEIPNKNCIEVGGQFIDCRLPESGRLIVEALLRIQGVGGRRPGTNITNHVYNNQPSIGTKNSISTTQPTSGFNKDNGDTINKGKPKRAAWDLKGRLQDMEQLMKSSTVERENFLAKLTDYDSRIENLELEKQNLNQNLQKTQTVSQANQEEVDRLKDNLRYVINALKNIK